MFAGERDSQERAPPRMVFSLIHGVILKDPDPQGGALAYFGFALGNVGSPRRWHHLRRS